MFVCLFVLPSFVSVARPPLALAVALPTKEMFRKYSERSADVTSAAATAHRLRRQKNVSIKKGASRLKINTPQKKHGNNSVKRHVLLAGNHCYLVFRVRDRRRQHGTLFLPSFTEFYRVLPSFFSSVAGGAAAARGAPVPHRCSRVASFFNDK